MVLDLALLFLFPTLSFAPDWARIRDTRDGCNCVIDELKTEPAEEIGVPLQSRDEGEAGIVRKGDERAREFWENNRSRLIARRQGVLSGKESANREERGARRIFWSFRNVSFAIFLGRSVSNTLDMSWL